MSDSPVENDKPSAPATVTTTAGESSAAAVGAATNAPSKLKTGRGLSVFAILLSLLALGGSGFTWFQTQVNNVQEDSRLALGVGEIGGQVTRLGDSITRLQQEQADVVSESELSTKVLELKSEIGDQIRALATQQGELSESVVKINSELQRGVNQFIVEEVSQLLRLANNSVLFDDDVQSASNALKLADEQLKGLRDPRFATVRSQINTELAALQNVQLVDVEAASAKLQAVAQGIPELALANEPEQRAAAQPVPEPEQELTLRGELVKIWRDLIGSVSIQRVDQPPKPLLVPEQRYFLNENIRLALATAELAMMQGEVEIYRRSIASAKQWLTEYFDLSDNQVRKTISQLDELSQINVRSEIPAITGSYQALQTVLGGQ